MSPLVLVSCLVSGLVFAVLATWLTTTRGNTISDVLNSEKFTDANAIQLKIQENLKITSNLPIVALYVVAFAVAILLPAFVYWQSTRDVTVITLSGVFRGTDGNERIYISPRDMRVERSGQFTIPIAYTPQQEQSVNIEGETLSPITLQVKIDPADSMLIVRVTNAVSTENAFNVPLDLRSRSATLAKHIDLVPYAKEVRPVPQRLSKPESPRSVFPEIEEHAEVRQ
ncbi:MAG TPA: hypothetical protein VHM88_22670 [Candidatus Acidoferrales bacterium]|nr:hypothetical protein [Candidatus Acidoferrales bacterium]